MRLKRAASNWSVCWERHYRNKYKYSIRLLFLTKQSRPIARISIFEEHSRMETKFIDTFEKLDIVWRKKKNYEQNNSAYKAVERYKIHYIY
jgi:hypothetical protein